MAAVTFLFALFFAPAAAIFWQPLFRWLGSRSTWLSWQGWAHEFRWAWRVAAACGVVAGLIKGDWWWTAGSLASLAIVLALSWWRKNRDKAKALLGAKSRALRDALSARMPRPVPLRPVQGGALWLP